MKQVAEHAPWIDGVELRIDLLETAEHSRAPEFPGFLEERLAAPPPAIATIRRPEDGGRTEIPDTGRLALLGQCARAGFQYVDLEADLERSGALIGTEQAILESGGTIIRSAHDFSGVPADLLERAKRMASISASAVGGAPEIVKLAVTPQSTADLASLSETALTLTREGIEHIILGMGEFGFPSRVLTARLGNHLTFASAPGQSAAPGHVSPEMIVDLYRAREVGPGARLFAVIGDPIAHSRSPHYHNARFREDGVDALYVPVRVDDADAFFEFARTIGILGFSVTIPHKQSVMSHLTEAGEDVQAAGACNTVVRIPGGWRGVNTDVIGFLAPLEEVSERELRDRRVLVLGAGGAARGVVYGLLSRGAHVVLFNRTQSRAEALAAELATYAVDGSITVATEADRSTGAEIVVNTTSLGMHGEGDPAPWYEFRGTEIAYDIVYTPPETPFIKRAISAGCRVITGDRMFEAQAAAQYELYRTLATASMADA